MTKKSTLPQLAKVGDSVKCSMKLPTPRSYIVKLTTPEAAALINDDLLSDDLMWEIVKPITQSPAP